jgi:hypothetical protein
MSETVDFTEESVKAYLDECIEHSRQLEDETKRLYYTDAYQSVRVSLFGELKE